MEGFQNIALGDLYETPLNNRRTFSEGPLADLTSSIRQKGVLTPLLVRERPHKGKRFEILAGARRFRAATRAELAQVPAMVRDFDDTAALEVVVIENLQREDVNALEEAEGYEQLLQRPGYDVAAIAAKVGKSESYVQIRLKLLDLIEPAKQALAKDEIAAGHALLLARLQPKDQQEALKEGCFDERWNGQRHEKVTVGVRGLAAWIEGNVHLDLKKAPFKTDDVDLVPSAGACTTCPKRTGFSPELFPEIAKKDTCTDRSCYHAKVQAGIARTLAELKAAGTPTARLSTDYNYQAPKKGQPLPENQWRELKKGAPACASTQTGVVVAGHHHHQWALGQVLQVCTNMKCKTHQPSHHMSGMGHKPSAAEVARREREKDEREQRAEVSRRLSAAVLEKLPTTLSRPELERLAVEGLNGAYGENEELIASVLGVELPKKKPNQYRSCAELFEKRVPDLDDGALAKFLALVPLLTELGDGGQFHGRNSMLGAAAAQYGVDVDGIKKAVTAEAKEKAKARAERKKKATKKAKGGKAKKKAAGKGAPAAKSAKAKPSTEKPTKTKAAKPPKRKRAAAPAESPPLVDADFDEAEAEADTDAGPECEVCGCTESNACKGGCSWDPEFKGQGRWVCSTPSCLEMA